MFYDFYFSGWFTIYIFVLFRFLSRKMSTNAKTKFILFYESAR